MEYQDYLKTDYWKEVSKAVKAKAGWKCQICNSPHDLNAHHRTYEHRGNELEHLDDMTCLCRRCHENYHGKGDEAEHTSKWLKRQGKAIPRAITTTSVTCPMAIQSCSIKNS